MLNQDTLAFKRKSKSNERELLIAILESFASTTERRKRKEEEVELAAAP